MTVSLLKRYLPLSNTSRKLLKKLKVKGIYLLDASVITLHHKKSGLHFPTAKANGPGGFKWHLCLDVLTGLPRWFSMTDALRNERNELPPFKLLKGALVIFDLGYWDYLLLGRLIEAKCFFLSRVMPNANIEILGYEGNRSFLPAKRNEKGRLFDYDWSSKKKNIVELLGKITPELHPTEWFETRVLGFWNPEANCYHWYITNLGVSAKLLYPIYRLRWQIELAFKATKSSLALDEVSSGNEYAIRNLFLASVLSYIIGQYLLRRAPLLVQETRYKTLSIQRITKVFCHVAEYLGAFLLHRSTRTYAALYKVINLYSEEIYDPNFKRRPTTVQSILAL